MAEATFRGYIVLVDYYSNFLEVIELPDTVERHPRLSTTDNGSQIVSQDLNNLPPTGSSNNFLSALPYVERPSRVSVAKNVSKKSFKDDRDLWLALPMSCSETDVSYTKNIVANRLHPKVVEGVDEQIKQKGKYYHDRTAEILPNIEVGQQVRVVPTKRKQPSKSATCVQLSDRSYSHSVDEVIQVSLELQMPCLIALQESVIKPSSMIVLQEKIAVAATSPKVYWKGFSNIPRDTTRYFIKT